MTFKDHFSGHADDYARFRPDYPCALFDWLANVTPDRQAVWDCGCGNGQASRQLSVFFRQVYATDASAGQIAKASGPENVLFRTAPAEQCGLDDASIDLVCVAQALHWFDVQRFYREAQRVARSNAVLAVWSYGSARVDGVDPEIISQFEHSLVGPYWPPERSWIDKQYANVDLPGLHIEAPQFDMQASWPLETLLGYIGSWSATHRYFAATGQNPLQDLRSRLAHEWGDPGTERLICWPLFVRASYLNSGLIS